MLAPVEEVEPPFPLQPLASLSVVGSVVPSGAVARVVSSVSLVTRLASGRALRVLGMNRPGVRGDAGLAPAVGLIGSLFALGG